MPKMRLDFLKNVSQRLATGRSMPLHQVEAALLYGKPAQRAKIVQKILPNVYALSLNKSTHYLLNTLLDKCDGLIRVQVLYQLRRKLVDLSRSNVGNIIVREMLEKLPAKQKKEIAEVFVLNAEEDEFKRLCTHRIGNYVAQKIIEYPSCCEVVEERFLPYLGQLALHEFGQRVVAKYVGVTSDGWKQVCKALFGLDDDVTLKKGKTGDDTLQERISQVIKTTNDNMTLSALLKHPLVPSRVKDALCAHLSEYAGEYLNPQSVCTGAQKGEKVAEDDEFAAPEFGDLPLTKASRGHDQGSPRHLHLYVTVFEYGDFAQRKELWDCIVAAPGLVDHIVSHKFVINVAVAAFKSYPESQDALWNALVGNEGRDVVEVSQDPVGTMLLRAAMEVDNKRFTAAHRRHLAESTLTLSQDPVSSPVIQKLLECSRSDEAVTFLIFESIKGEVQKLVLHSSASYVIQVMLQHGSLKLRGMLVEELIGAFLDMRNVLSYAQGSRVMQKLLAYASDEVVARVAGDFIAASQAEGNKKGDEARGDGRDETGEEQDVGVGGRRLSRKKIREMNRNKHYGVDSHALVSYSLHSHACYVVQALLRECTSRGLDTQRKHLMNELKPFVFELSISPWAGRIVLETMQQCGSAQLKEAMSNVVFLKVETWLTGAGEKEKGQGTGLNPTLRQTLRRTRKEDRNGSESTHESPARKRPFKTAE
ncbi:pumilio/PUF RNA binding protein 7, putative [Trypanosoma equiperdum]|uniref:Pumilio/PUF RNA binding protein 7, putative n=1 Tax=Trypanosoma equiperdum TaxID=5694 RepID=A0A1G4I1S8_TRYEQ|nr:pumilio/PUF RNA binding protein 7, putative [Trypanosoma equiperdum]